MTKYDATLILTRSELKSLMNLEDYLEGIENAFKAHGEGLSYGTDMIHGSTPSDLEFHIKSGGLPINSRRYYGLKINSSCFTNKEKMGLPNIQGAILLFDGVSGFPLAIIDSIEPTIMRTGAGTAVALKYLADPKSHTITICGCGNQGKIQLRFAKSILPLTKAYVYDLSADIAEEFSREMACQLNIKILSTSDIKNAISNSQVVITCTPSKKPYVKNGYLQPGATLAAVGADTPDKQEIEEQLFKNNKIVTDILLQCQKAGEIHHALMHEVITITDVYAEIGEIVAGRKPGRENESEIIIYDSTGTALQDTAAASICFEKAISQKKGRYINLAG